MKTQQLKDIYKQSPDKWIVVTRCDDIREWNEARTDLKISHLESDIEHTNGFEFKLIHIKHKKILEAYLADNSVEIEYMLWYYEGNAHEIFWKSINFIENYDPDREYRLKEEEDVYGERENGTTDDVNPSTNTGDSDRTISKLNNFQDYGFTGNFSGEILKEVNGRYIGYYIDEKYRVTPTYWSSMGGTDNHLIPNLKPIPKPWYENKANFPCLLVRDDNYVSGRISDRIICHSMLNWNILYFKTWRLATKEEVLSLYYEGKEDD